VGEKGEALRISEVGFDDPIEALRNINTPEELARFEGFAEANSEQGKVG
jgi:hypothetical protein